MTVVALSGQLDSRAAPDFEQTLGKLVAGGKHELLLDLAALEYVASAGLRVFVVIGKRLQADGGRLALCSLGAGVRKVLEVAGFIHLFPIRSDRNDAIQWLLESVRAARVTNLAGDLLRREGGGARPAAFGMADSERAALARELLSKTGENPVPPAAKPPDREKKS